MPDDPSAAVAAAAPVQQPTLCEKAATVVSHKRGCGRAISAGLVAKLDDETLQAIVAADEQPGGDQLVDNLLSPPEAEDGE